MNYQLKDEYSSEEEIKLVIAEYNKGKKPEEKMRYCSYYNSYTRKRMYVPCTIEYFHAWRNMHAEERRKRDMESRCLVPSERYSYMKRCMEDCSQCPFGKTHRDGKPLSLDQFIEDYNFEMADMNSESPHEVMMKSELEEAIEHEVSQLDEKNQQLLDLFKNGYTDDEIGKIMGLKRSTVQYRKTSLFKLLREKLKNFI